MDAEFRDRCPHRQGPEDRQDHRHRLHRRPLRPQGAAGGGPLGLLVLRTDRDGGRPGPYDEEEHPRPRRPGAARRRLPRPARHHGRGAPTHRLRRRHRDHPEDRRPRGGHLQPARGDLDRGQVRRPRGLRRRGQADPPGAQRGGHPAALCHRDLLAQDRSNTLWRYDGNGSGGFKPRAKVASGWGSSYNVVVGVGDITGDGKADIVSRDTSGNLWRNSGNGSGSFGPRTKIASGRQAYKGVF
ncbi:FG-GAP repeat domain-containing protein [Streptomyces mirabilis]|uniref:FG-GAP repeat domain-containing protein n=1 Tax=Streptomyces mirabilis TaxID=68239 RepID=UPI0036DC0920